MTRMGSGRAAGGRPLERQGSKENTKSNTEDRDVGAEGPTRREQEERDERCEVPRVQLHAFLHGGAGAFGRYRPSALERQRERPRCRTPGICQRARMQVVSISTLM